VKCSSGFCCVGEAARVPGMTEEPPTVDVGMGMDPQRDVPGRVSQSAGPPAPGLCADAPADAAGLDRTHVGCAWAFPKEAAAKPDFDPSYALEFWDLTNRQDWAACESVQRPALTARAAGATRAGRGRRVPVRHPGGSGLRRGSLSLHRRRSPRTVGDRHLWPVRPQK
jgi:hypothetical protein